MKINLFWIDDDNDDDDMMLVDAEQDRLACDPGRSGEIQGDTQ